MQGPPDFTPIDDLLGGYRAAQIVIAGVRLGVFDALESDFISSDELAHRISADPRGVRILCDALVALDLLEKRDGRYINSGVSSVFLTGSSPASRVATVRHAAALYERWGRLADAVKQGAKVPDDRLDPRLRGDKQAFAAAMAAIGKTSASQTADVLDLAGERRLLDVGGGPAVYAIEFARRHPRLEVVVLDDAETLETARRNVDEAGLAERVQLLPGDIFADDPGGPYDVAFVSNLVHIYSEPENRRLTRRCADALKPGGRLAIKDFILDPNRTSPRWTALFAVNMLVGSDSGDCYTLDQIRSWLEEAGLRLQRVDPVTGQSSLVVASKPEEP